MKSSLKNKMGSFLSFILLLTFCLFFLNKCMVIPQRQCPHSSWIKIYTSEKTNIYTQRTRNCSSKPSLMNTNARVCCTLYMYRVCSSQEQGFIVLSTGRTNGGGPLGTCNKEYYGEGHKQQQQRSKGYTLPVLGEKNIKRTEWLQGNYVPHTSSMTMRSVWFSSRLRE